MSKLSKKVVAALNKPNRDRIWWCKRRPLGQMVSSTHPTAAWPAAENVLCWCYEGGKWNRGKPVYPGDRTL